MVRAAFAYIVNHRFKLLYIQEIKGHDVDTISSSDNNENIVSFL